MNKLTLQEYANKHNVFTSQDGDGKRYEYELNNKPTIGITSWCTNYSEGYKDITNKTLPFKGDWTDSLCEPKKEKEMEYKIGKKYVVTYYEENLNICGFCNNPNNHRILVDYIPKSNTPFICVSWGYEDEYKNDRTFDTCEWKYAKPIPEYKPYKEPKLEWIGKKVLSKEFKTEFTIYGIVRENQIMLDNNAEYTLEDFFEYYTWLNGSVCGEVKGEKDV